MPSGLAYCLLYLQAPERDALGSNLLFPPLAEVGLGTLSAAAAAAAADADAAQLRDNTACFRFGLTFRPSRLVVMGPCGEYVWHAVCM